MKAQALRDSSIEELNKQLIELYREQFNLRMQKGMGEAPRPHIFKQVRRDIARIKTIIKQKGANE
ncbi:MAG: 50S ribosomal protein L29 [Coxiellaceae bacterium]|nr:50S ribosomal protein L29 [Coxiellaceae bacterium]